MMPYLPENQTWLLTEKQNDHKVVFYLHVEAPVKDSGNKSDYNHN